MVAIGIGLPMLFVVKEICREQIQYKETLIRKRQMSSTQKPAYLLMRSKLVFL